MKDQRRMLKILREMFENTAYFDSELLVGVLLVGIERLMFNYLTLYRA